MHPTQPPSAPSTVLVFIRRENFKLDFRLDSNSSWILVRAHFSIMRCKLMHCGTIKTWMTVSYRGQTVLAVQALTDSLHTVFQACLDEFRCCKQRRAYHCRSRTRDQRVRRSSFPTYGLRNRNPTVPTIVLGLRQSFGTDSRKNDRWTAERRARYLLAAFLQLL